MMPRVGEDSSWKTGVAAARLHWCRQIPHEFRQAGRESLIWTYYWPRCTAMTFCHIALLSC